MEKLVELLNEYEKKDYHKVQHKIKDGKVYRSIGNFDEWIPIWWYSKSFGFIKWLVDNDKIRKDIYRPIPLRIKATYEDGVVYHDKLEDRIIMLLSISDTPIEDLISYLHE